MQSSSNSQFKNTLSESCTCISCELFSTLSFIRHTIKFECMTSVSLLLERFITNHLHSLSMALNKSKLDLSSMRACQFKTSPQPAQNMVSQRLFSPFVSSSFSKTPKWKGMGCFWIEAIHRNDRNERCEYYDGLWYEQDQ